MSKVNKKLVEFYYLMERKGYKVERLEESVDPFHYGNLTHIVTKDNYYHVAIIEKIIVDAPLDYTVKLVEKEFDNLEATH